MVHQSERLRRRVGEGVTDGCDVDVDAHVAALEDDAALPTGADADRAAMRALGDETRYRIVRLLVEGERERCVCEITPVVDVTESAISHALSDLADAGLVTRRKDGTWRYYEATERARALVAALDLTREVDR